MNSERYHLVGVAGVGMSALAEALLARGARVSGSDRFLDQGAGVPTLDILRAAGVALHAQDGSGVTADTTGVIVSTAIEPDNPDFEAARAMGVPVLHRAEMLARLVRGRRVIAVAGTSGKTTVTGLTGWLLEQGGLKPTVVNGGAVLNWKGPRALGNIRDGRDDLWVIEADESDRSFLHFEPDWEIITNISRDHFELPETLDLFRTFARKGRAGVVCGRGVAEALRGGDDGIGEGALIETSFDDEERGGQAGFVCEGRFFPSPLPGRHNVENAWLAVVLCRRLGVPLPVLGEALPAFRGIERRLERVGESGGVVVMDDYAHNPAKISAAWRTMAQLHRRVLGTWRPHGFGPLAAMRRELGDLFAAVCRPEDRLYLLPVYYVGGTATRAVTSDDLARDLRARGVRVETPPDYPALLAALKSEARAGDAVLFMGARDPELPRAARRFLKLLSASGAGHTEKP